MIRPKTIRSIFPIFLLLGLTSAVFSQAETRHIHLLKIFDSENQDYIIREATKSIELDIDREVRLIQQYLDIYTLHEYKISGLEFNREKLLQVIDYEMSYLEGDIVIIAYVGHGYRHSDMPSTAPMLFMNSYENSINFVDVQSIIREKRPSVMLSIVLACNRTQSDYNAPPDLLVGSSPVTKLTPKGGVSNAYRTQKYKALFSEIDNYTKCIDLFGADKEYYTFINQEGGVFFNEILNVFHETFTEQSYSTWEDICETISVRTINRLSQLGIKAQRPSCSYYISIFPVSINKSSEQLLNQQYLFKQEKKSLKKRQKQQLKQLRLTHKAKMRTARQEKKSKKERSILSLQNKSELAKTKAQHRTDLLRLERRYGQ